MSGAHFSGGGLGAIVAIVLSALGHRVGLHLTDAEAASFAVGLVGVGIGIAHAFWTVGIFPIFSRLIHGPTKPAAEPKVTTGGEA